VGTDTQESLGIRDPWGSEKTWHRNHCWGEVWFFSRWRLPTVRMGHPDRRAEKTCCPEGRDYLSSSRSAESKLESPCPVRWHFPRIVGDYFLRDQTIHMPTSMPDHCVVGWRKRSWSFFETMAWTVSRIRICLLGDSCRIHRQVLPGYCKLLSYKRFLLPLYWQGAVQHTDGDNHGISKWQCSQRRALGANFNHLWTKLPSGVSSVPRCLSTAPELPILRLHCDRDVMETVSQVRENILHELHDFLFRDEDILLWMRHKKTYKCYLNYYVFCLMLLWSICQSFFCYLSITVCLFSWPICSCFYDRYANLLADTSSSSRTSGDNGHSEVICDRTNDNCCIDYCADDKDFYGLYANLLSGTSPSSTTCHCNLRSDALPTRM
jgi:hypothetical protein